MNVVNPHFTVEDDIEATAEPTPERAADHAAATQMLMLGLAALSKRTLVALADLFCLLTVGSVFWLFTSIRDPNVMQLIQLGGYCVFILVANWLVRRR